MVTRIISLDAAAPEFAELIRQVSETGDKVVIDIGGTPLAKVVPLNHRDDDETFRDAFAGFWNEHKAYMDQNPSGLSEDESMALAIHIVQEVRDERRREIREAAMRIQERDHPKRSA